jgi:hypothetical protein
VIVCSDRSEKEEFSKEQRRMDWRRWWGRIEHAKAVEVEADGEGIRGESD